MILIYYKISIKWRITLYGAGDLMEEKEGMRQINLKLTIKQHQELETLSRKLGDISKSNLIRLAISEFLYKYKDFE